ncbi:histidine kinase [Lysinibacillus sp. NPDC094177]|uniref:histidine kinase n=1 Tax=Lysinibacillus sp. NPDC094177 TaxID=3390580 RepID=UPI003D030D93
MWRQVAGWLSIVCVLIVMLYMNFSDQDTRLVNEHANNGVLDLTTLHDLDKLVALSGEWKFTPNVFIDPKEFKQDAANQIVPGPWDADAQYGSYQLLIKIPEHFSEVGFRVRNIWSAHTIYINGEKLSEVGHIGTTKAETNPHNPSYEFYIKPKSKQLLMTIHVANFYNARGGIIFPIDFGDAFVMKQDVEDDFQIEWTGTFLLLIFSMFHLTIYLLRKKDVAFFYSGVYFFSLALVVMTRGERILYRKFPNLSFDFYFRLQDSITFFSSLLLILFIIRTMPTFMKKKQLIVLFSPVVLYAVGILLLPARTLSSLQYVFFFYMNILLVGLIVRFIVLIYQKKWLIPKNEILILGIMLMFLLMFLLSGSIDQLFFSGRNIFNRFGLLGFAISMNVFLGIRLINRTEDAEKLSDRLEKANLSKDAFLDVTTEELKNPLYQAINLTKSVQLEKGHTQLYIIEQLLERLLYLVNDLQDFTRIRFQDYAFDLQSTNASMIVRHVAQLMDFSFSRKQIEFEECIPETLHVLADEKRLAQVFYRILEESSYYATNGRIVVNATHVQHEVILTFKAIGDRTQFPKKESKEIGLLMGKELIERMNGQLHIHYHKEGVDFIVRLPFEEYKSYLFAEHAAVINTNEWIASSIDEQNDLIVLIVEDEPIHAEVYASMLSDLYKVMIVYTAQEALMKIEQEPNISLVIIDEVMPGIDGIELTKQIRQKASLMELPIIMTTSNDYPKNLEVIFSSGANDYLIKPVTKEAVLARLSAVEQTKRAMMQAVEHEMAFLQAQIKPHFLYNALSSIISFCYTDGERAAYLLSMLSSYLRYIFESGKEGHHSTLQKELDIIEAYVEVEKARFGDRLSFLYEIDDSINPNEIEIPSLLIQPLVENAIRHGIFEKEGKGHVQLTISKQGQNLFINVVDDGIGMSDEQCRILLEERTSSNGIGFTNVLRRVREFSKGNLTIHSTLGEGTYIAVTFPIKEN